MQSKTAKTVADALRQELALSHRYNCLKQLPVSPVNGLYPLANGQPGRFAGLIQKQRGAKYWVAISPWYNNLKGEYLLVFPESRVTTVMEIHAERNLPGSLDLPDLYWRYAPRRHDGQNNIRQRIFRRLAGTLEPMISVPSKDVSVDEFLDDLFDICDCITVANDLEELDQNAPLEFMEGRRLLRRHLKRERSSAAVSNAKKLHRKRHGGRLPCEACGMDFREFYGELGDGFIEAHHKIPMAELPRDEERPVSAEDFAMLCSNCHRMVHQERPCMEVSRLQTIVKSFHV